MAQKWDKSRDRTRPLHVSCSWVHATKPLWVHGLARILFSSNQAQ